MLEARRLSSFNERYARVMDLFDEICTNFDIVYSVHVFRYDHIVK